MLAIMKKFLFICLCLALLSGCTFLPDMPSGLPTGDVSDELVKEIEATLKSLDEGDIPDEFLEELETTLIAPDEGLYQNTETTQTATPFPTATPFQPVPDKPVLIPSESAPTETVELTEESPDDSQPVADQATPTFDAATELPTATEGIPTVTETPPVVEEPTAAALEPPVQGNIPNPMKPAKGFPSPMPDLTSAAPGKVINYLLLGSDTKTKGPFRTDTIVVVSIRPEEGSVSLISIPRDLYVYIPAKGMHKINTAYLWGNLNRYPGRGPASIKDTLMYNLGIRIDKIAIVNFDSFRQVIDILGGVDLPLFCQYSDRRFMVSPGNWRTFSIGPGLVHMDGDLALWYPRARMNSSDYDRGRRQQEVLRALYERAVKLDILPRLPEMYEKLSKNIQTDASLSDLLPLAPMAVDFDSAKIRSYYITAGMVKPGFVDGMYVQWPKTDKIMNMIQRALAPPAEKGQVKSVAQVEVCNASGKKGWDDLAAERLHYAGYKTTGCTLTELDRTKNTTLQNLHPGENLPLGAELLGALGFPLERMVELNEPANSVPFRLIVGSGYDPCFSPLKLTH